MVKAAGEPLNKRGGKFGHLLYRNQFVLGPSAKGFESWNTAHLGSGLCVHAHPELNLIRAGLGGRSAVLLGYILDPLNPEANDADILEELLGKSSGRESLIRNTAEYGGRWIIIMDDGEERYLFTDAAGLRQVFYAEADSGLWCASQPGMLARLLDLKTGSRAEEFINSDEFRRDDENRWPGESSAYAEIKHLLPNHWLNLKTGERKRYWPDGPLDVIDVEEGVRRATGRLKGLMRSAAHRFDLALSITAGLDSRLAMAASRDIRGKLDFVTVKQVRMPENHADIIVPSKLLSKLGLPHTIIKSGYAADGEFLKTFHENVDFAHRVYAHDAYAIQRHGGLKKVAVTGSVSEIARCSYRVGGAITGETLSRLQRMGTNRFAIDHFERWLAGLGNIYNLHPLDIFEWEQGHGNWLAMCQLEFDSAWKDIFTPFNCRALLLDMLSVREEFRRPPDYTFYKLMISRLWPEVLGVPVNPHLKAPFYSRLDPRLKAMMKKILGLFR